MTGATLPEVNISEVLEKIGELAEQIPALVENTVTIGLLSSKIPDEGFDVAAAMRHGIDTYVASRPELPQGAGKVIAQLNAMSDDELVEMARTALEERGLDELAGNLADGNLSRDDFIRGAAEFGHTVGEEGGVSPASLTQIQNLVGDSNDPALIEGLVLAESYVDGAMVNAAQMMSELNEAKLVGMFDGKAFSFGEAPTETEFNPEDIAPVGVSGPQR